jgi:hypothetical protein
MQAKLEQIDWNLVNCDEAYKPSATFFGSTIKYIKCYRLTQHFAGLTHQFLFEDAYLQAAKLVD